MAPYDCHLRTGRLAAVASSIRVMGSVWCVIYGVGIAVDLVVGGLHSGYESVEGLFVSLLFLVPKLRVDDQSLQTDEIRRKINTTASTSAIKVDGSEIVSFLTRLRSVSCWRRGIDWRGRMPSVNGRSCSRP